MLKPFDYVFGYSKVISLSSDDVSLQDGDSIGSDVMMTSLCNPDIISMSSARLLLLKWHTAKIPLCQSIPCLHLYETRF